MGCRLEPPLSLDRPVSNVPWIDESHAHQQGHRLQEYGKPGRAPNYIVFSHSLTLHAMCCKGIHGKIGAS